MRLSTLTFLVMLTLSIGAVPLAAIAQQTAKVYRIDCLPGGPLAPRAHQWDAFRQALRALGWVEGQNMTLEFRPPAGEGDPFDELAAELVRLKVDVIVATGTSAVRAAKWSWPHDTGHMWEVVSPHLSRYEVGMESICRSAMMRLTLHRHRA